MKVAFLWNYDVSEDKDYSSNKMNPVLFRLMTKKEEVTTDTFMTKPLL